MNLQQATLTCPNCQALQTAQIPDDACVPFYKCENCGALINAKEGDCCVFCSYGSEKCPVGKKK